MISFETWSSILKNRNVEKLNYQPKPIYIVVYIVVLTLLQQFMGLGVFEICLVSVVVSWVEVIRDLWHQTATKRAQII